MSHCKYLIRIHMYYIHFLTHVSLDHSFCSLLYYSEPFLCDIFRGLFIIDPKGILRQITMNDLPVGRSVDETLRLVQAFQYTDKHGEVCPAGWKPGSDTVCSIVNSDKFEIRYKYVFFLVKRTITHTTTSFSYHI